MVILFKLQGNKEKGENLARSQRKINIDKNYVVFVIINHASNRSLE